MALRRTYSRYLNSLLSEMRIYRTLANWFVSCPERVGGIQVKPSQIELSSASWWDHITLPEYYKRNPPAPIAPFTARQIISKHQCVVIPNLALAKCPPVRPLRWISKSVLTCERARTGSWRVSSGPRVFSLRRITVNTTM